MPRDTFIARLPERVREAVLLRCRPVAFDPGQYLLRQGDRDRRALVLLDGLVKIRVVDPSGFAAVLAVRRAGDIIGELGALTGDPRTASALAATPVRAGAISGGDLIQLLAAHPVAVHELIRTQSRRLEWANQRRIDSAARPARWKVARALSELVHETDEKGAATPVHLSQRELASLVGVGLNTAEEALRALAAMGLVNRRYRLIVVPDPARLRAFAEADSQNP